MAKSLGMMSSDGLLAGNIARFAENDDPSWIAYDETDEARHATEIQLARNAGDYAMADAIRESCGLTVIQEKGATTVAGPFLADPEYFMRIGLKALNDARDLPYTQIVDAGFSINLPSSLIVRRDNITITMSGNHNAA